MDLLLKRRIFSEGGIFGELFDSLGLKIAVTLEHSYPVDGGWIAKIPNPGVFLCFRGSHQLHGMKQPFETFEITGVQGHSNLLFHAGNFNRDSEGCILLGRDIENGMITHSRDTFEQFMELQNDIESFYLTVLAVP